MRIAYVITRADAVGGASVHVRDMARAMIGRGHEAVVLVGGSGPVTEQLKAAGVPFRSLRFLQRPIRPLRDLRALGELTAALREVRPDIVSVHTAKAGWLGRAACARLRIPAVYTPHGWSIGERISRVGGLVFGAAERAAAGWAQAIICVCEYERRLALSKRVAPPERLHVVYNAVHDVTPDLVARPETTPVRIVSVARFEAPKDHATLLRALASMRDQEWELDLVGEGPLEPAMRRLALELGMESRVRFLGYQADPAPVLARSHIFALSSRSEGFPRSILEALRAGLPVVASDVGGVREAVLDGVNGRVVERGNAAQMSAALRELAADHTQRQRLGGEARQSFMARFGCHRMVEETVRVYNRVQSGAA